MYKILVVVKSTGGWSSTTSIALTSQLIEFKLRAEAEKSLNKLRGKEGYEITKLYD